MTIRERYKIFSVNKIKKNKKIYFTIVLFFVISFTFASYTHLYEETFSADVANWKISINDELINENTTLANKIKFICDDNESENGVILPGQTGYFDINIDPSGTEVSIEYEILLDFSNMPEDMQITGYTLNSVDPEEKEDFPSNNKFTGIVRLNNNNQLEETNKQTYRVYWKWLGNNIITEDIDYSVSAQVKVKQLIEEIN